jgi:dTDP-glucose 4,6-dehydratase
MRLLVTGGCGFIGTNFILLALRERPGTRILNLDKLTYAGNRANLRSLEEEAPGPDGPRYAFAQGDIADPAAVGRCLAEFAPDAIVNFAAETHVDRSIADPAPFVTTNVLGTQTLLSLAREHRVARFVHVSTDEVYGSLGPAGQFHEDTPLAPSSPYSASKAASDLLVRAFHHTYGLDTVITRCSNNYGPYQFPEKLIPLMVQRALRDQPLPVYGHGGNVRDWIFVDDHCRGVLLALEKGRPGAVYNFGGDAELENLAVVKAILDRLGKPHRLISFVQDRPGHDLRYAMNFDLARRELGFAPSVDFGQGLAATLDWYLANPEWVRQVESGEHQAFMGHWYKERA